MVNKDHHYLPALVAVESNLIITTLGTATNIKRRVYTK